MGEDARRNRRGDDMIRTMATWTTIGLLATGAASAQVVRDQAERAADRGEIRADARQRRDDLRDLARLQSLAARFDAARAAGDGDALRAVLVDLRGAVAGELAEGRVESAQARVEARRGAREARASRREAVRASVAERPAAEGDDRRDLRDDRRDRRDDARDAAVQARTQARRREIAAEMRVVLGSLDPAGLGRTRVLLDELIVLARAEAARDGREIREDRRELREDRRETREDLHTP